MGADGGVSWVTLRRDADVSELHALLAPWWYWLTRLGSRSYEDSRHDWIREHSHGHPRAVWGGYGTDLDACDDPTWGDLARWAQHLDDALTEPARGLWEGATFGDYLDEIDTRGDGWYWCGEESGLARWVECLRERPEGLDGMPLRAWLDGLARLLASLDAVSVETWT